MQWIFDHLMLIVGMVSIIELGLGLIAAGVDICNRLKEVN